MSIAASFSPTPVVAAAALPVPTPADREPAAHPFAELLRQSRGSEPPAVEAARPASADTAKPSVEPGSEPTTASDDKVPGPDRTPKSDAGRARARTGATTPRSAAVAPGPTEQRERLTGRDARDADRSPPDASTAAATPTLVAPDAPAAAATPERVAPDASTATANATPVAPDASTAAANAAPVAADTSTVAANNPSSGVRTEALRPADRDLRVGSAANRFPTAAGAGRDADTASTLTPTSGPSQDSAAGHTQTARADTARADLGRSAARAADGDAAASATPFAQILAGAKSAERPDAATPAAETPLPAMPIAAPASQPPAVPDNALAPQDATLPVAIDSPEFASALGVQVSVFVREGVQHAELHLNPVETGPVSISISLEGSQARVEFGADLAATRQAIENGLPALASALRDAGFTLAGGGVAQHSRSGGGSQDRDDAADRGRPEGRTVRGGEAIAGQAVQLASRRVAAGGIDLFA